MSHFYEAISKKRINYSLEFEKIKQLFEDEEIEYYNDSYKYLSLKNIIGYYFFRKMDLSYNYTSIELFFNDAMSAARNECDIFVFYIEAILSLIYQLLTNFNFLQSNKTSIAHKVNEINRIITIDLELMCATKKQITNKLGDVIVIIPKDELLENVLENISDDEAKMKLIDYKNHKNEGNIKEKENILRSIYPYLEGICKSSLLQQNKRLFSDMDFLYNNLHLKHNNETINDTRFYAETLPNREEWLDRAYRETLLVISSTIENDDHGQIVALKRKVDPDRGTNS